MNKWIAKLANVAQGPDRLILGVISGTSMDGLDMALCRVTGSSLSTGLEVLQYGSVAVGSRLKETFYELAYHPDVPLPDVLRFQTELGRAWSAAIAAQIDEWEITVNEIDILASHGQTIFHHPDREGPFHGTWQIVDGDLLAQDTGILTVSDFRQKHIAAGYEGAPLAPLGEVLLYVDEQENRVLLNLGGIANFTILKTDIQEPAVPFATDTGPANTLLDEAVRQLIPGKSYDDNGDLARSGAVDETLLSRLLEHPFFSQPFPKSTGQEEFHCEWVNRCLAATTPDLETAGLLATLTELSAKTAGEAIAENLESGPCTVYVSGGGWHNRYLIERLTAYLPGYRIVSSSDLGVNPDAKEAALFAVLASETVAGQGWINEKGEQFTLGKISLPG